MEKIGVSVAIIIDNTDENIKNVVMKDDGTGNAITLPRAEYIVQTHSPGGSGNNYTIYVNDYDGKKKINMKRNCHQLNKKNPASCEAGFSVFY